MEGLVDSLMEEMNCNVAFTIPIFGGIDVLESVAVTWIVMAVIMIVSLILVQGLKFRKIRANKRLWKAAYPSFTISLKIFWERTDGRISRI